METGKNTKERNKSPGEKGGEYVTAASQKAVPGPVISSHHSAPISLPSIPENVPLKSNVSLLPSPSCKNESKSKSFSTSPVLRGLANSMGSKLPLKLLAISLARSAWGGKAGRRQAASRCTAATRRHSGMYIYPSNEVIRIGSQVLRAKYSTARFRCAFFR